MATDLVLGISFLPLDQPTDHGALADAVLRFYTECGLRPDRIHTSQWRRTRVFRETTLREAILDRETRHIAIWFDRVPEISFYLRPANPHDLDFEVRWGAVISARLPPVLSESVRALLLAIAQLHPLSQGCVAGYRSAAYAGRECSFSGAFGNNEIDPETVKRLGEDEMSRRRAHHKLRRLYPVTIIGPDIWSQLPPMPAFDPMPTIENLGNCKMLTCWPELVEPRDPAFLAGTKELRRWLWPFTIQNPADAVDLDLPLPQG